MKPAWIGMLYWRLLKPHSMWHHRIYPTGYRVALTEEGISVVRFRGSELPLTSARSLSNDVPAANLLCSGPSVKLIKNPALLSRRPLIAVNGSFQILPENGPIDFYVVNDANFVRRRFDLFRKGVRKSRNICLSHMAIAAALETEPALLLGHKVCALKDVRYPFGEHKPSDDELRADGVLVEGRHVFSANLERGVGASGTVAYVALQLAYALRFETVYVFGLDLTPSGRYYAENLPEPSSVGALGGQMESCFRFAAQHVVNEKFRVYNCSLESHLPDDVFPKLDPNQALLA